MTEYYIVEPEVAGGWGDNTEFTRTLGQHDNVTKFHYEFQGWLGDALLTSTPCYIGTEMLAEAIKEKEFSGIIFDDVEVTKSELFNDIYPGRKLPKFLWFRIDGTPERDDFGITDTLDLVVSEHALEVLRQHGLSYADVAPIHIT